MSCLPSNYHGRILCASLVMIGLHVSMRSENIKQGDGARAIDDETLLLANKDIPASRIC